MDAERLPRAHWRHAPAAFVRGLVRLARHAREGHALDAAAFKQAMVPFVHHLPSLLRAWLQQAWRRRGPDTVPPPAPSANYAQRYAEETETFDDQAEVHDLPPIFHYWSNRWLLPMLEDFGATDPENFLANHLFATQGRRFVSLGCGNCDAEIRIALQLRDRGLRDFTIECVDMNETMLERGRVAAREHGVEACIRPVPGDFNRWRASGRYDAVIANQSLHHMLELEHVFDEVARALGNKGKFIVSDMIGRNGHQRWPEALALVREFWQELPAHYRRNVQLDRQEDVFMDWDCSAHGFEGIRAQDILPLMLERFGFEQFLAFGNLVDPFIDRGFGPHFDAEAAWDRDFIDRVHRRDEDELQAGRITPTHLLAVVGTRRDVESRHRPGVSPRSAVRRV